MDAVVDTNCCSNGYTDKYANRDGYGNLHTNRDTNSNGHANASAY